MYAGFGGIRYDIPLDIVGVAAHVNGIEDFGIQNLIIGDHRVIGYAVRIVRTRRRGLGNRNDAELRCTHDVVADGHSLRGIDQNSGSCIAGIGRRVGRPNVVDDGMLLVSSFSPVTIRYITYLALMHAGYNGI
jgi:hypothetical protein